MSRQKSLQDRTRVYRWVEKCMLRGDAYAQAVRYWRDTKHKSIAGMTQMNKRKCITIGRHTYDGYNDRFYLGDPFEGDAAFRIHHPRILKKLRKRFAAHIMAAAR